jgi:hypothetical protein
VTVLAVGRKNPSLLRTTAPAEGLVPTGHVVVCGHKPMRLGLETYAYGEVIPNWESWPRLEARFRARIITTLPAEAATIHEDLHTEVPETDEHVTP